MAESQNLDVSAVFNIRMPSNYTPYGITPQEKQQQFFAEADEKIAEIARTIVAGERFREKDDTGFLKTHIHPGLLYKLGYKYIAVMAKSFVADEKCNGCAICQRVCPVANITLEERLAAPDKPGFCMGRPTALLRTKIIPICKTALGETRWEELALERGAVGELLVSGEHVCRDYYNNPDAVRENKIMGPDNIIWHRMGDTGYFDEQDRFWLVGRVHSTMYRDRVAVHPQLLEQAAQAADPGIVRAAAVGLPDAKLGERIIVVVQVVQDVAGLADAVRQRLAAAGYPCDEVVVTGKTLPLDPRHNSKIEYGQLRAQLLGRK